MTTEEPRGGSAGLARALLAWLLPGLVLALAAVRLYRSPWVASHLSVPPDTVEYAVCAQRFATLGRYDLEINGVSYPPHSPPWFSVGFLSPAYFLAPGELGAGIWVVFLFSLAGVLAAYAVGKWLAGEWGGAAAATALGCNGVFRTYSREIMTDVPAVALGLWALWMFTKFRERERPIREWWIAGVLCAAAQAIRSESLALYLPFAWLAIRSRRSVPKKALALGVPCAAVAIATAIYHQVTFGDFRRSGYQFWTPIPWDYPELLFGTSYLGQNLKVLVEPWNLPSLVLGAVGLAVLLLRRNRGLSPVVLFFALSAAIPSIAHLFFFFSQARFHLLAMAILSVVGGAGVVRLVPETWRRRAAIAAAAIPLLLIALPYKKDAPPYRRIIAEVLARETPEDAVIVSRVDPVCLEPIVLRGTSRRIIPTTRDVEYASKAVAWKRIPRIDPPPAGPTDHRAPGLLAAGAQDVIEFTADEAPERLAELVRAGKPVFIEGMYVPIGFSQERMLGSRLEVVPHPVHRWLGRLRLRG